MKKYDRIGKIVFTAQLCIIALLLLYGVRPFIASALNMALLTGGGGINCLSGTYILAWNGELSDPNDACDSLKVKVDGANTNLPISTSYGYSGSYGVRVEDVDEYLAFNNTGPRVDFSEPQTIWCRIYVSANPDAASTIVESWHTVNVDGLAIVINTDGTMFGFWEDNGDGETAYGNNLIVGEWEDIAYSWDQANNKHAAYSGDGENDVVPFSDGAWEEDEDAGGLNVLSDDPDDIVLGTNGSMGFWGGGDPGAGKYIDIDRCVLVPGYQTAKPW